MQDDVWIRTHNLIELYDLHRTTPVKLWPLEDEYLVRMVDTGDVLGAILPPPQGWPTHTENRARILVNNRLTDNEQRITIAHEIGHGVCHHVGDLSARHLNLEDKTEREAWEVAAMLLIPLQTVIEEKEVRRIASACNVPDWLVSVWQSISV